MSFLLFLFLSVAAAQTSPGDQLAKAAGAGDFAEVRRLLDAGVSPNSEFRGYASTWFPLFLAVEGGHADVVGLLLMRGADPRQTCYGVSGPGRPLEYAVAFGKVEIVRVLLSKVAWKPEELVEALAYGGYYDSSIPALELLLAAGADVNALTRNGARALLNAAEHGNLPVVQFLLGRGADPALCTPSAGPALVAAAWGGDLELVDFLLNAGVPADQSCPQRPGWTALAQAASSANLPVVRRLAAAGARLDDPDPNTGVTPLMRAARRSRSAETIAFLLESGADPNREDKEGRTPLVHLAAAQREGDVDAAKALLAHRADPELLDGKTGLTPLMLAIGESNKPLVGLLAASVEVDRKSRVAADRSGQPTAGGHTALMVAAAENQLDAVLTLLVAGADPEAKDALGFNALDYARRKPGIALLPYVSFSREPDPRIESVLLIATRRKAAADAAPRRGADALQRARLAAEALDR